MPHNRNLHKNGYPMAQLVESYPRLKKFIKNKTDGVQTIQFSDPDAVKALNAALLAHYYQIPNWDIPTGYLCPPIPGRADYIHHIADLLAEGHGNEVPTGKAVRGLDIGTGANLIYPMIGVSEYDWQWVAADIDALSIKSARAIIDSNSSLTSYIEVRKQSNASNIFSGVVQPGEHYAFCMCNPPFHKSAAEAAKGSARKNYNLNKHSNKRGSSLSQNTMTRQLNFAGQSNELWCDGGELKFIQSMIKQSTDFKTQIEWFTCLVSKKEHLNKIKLNLKKAYITDSKVINMSQGQKISRFIAWRF
ncbi:23S rRNA (adenine(1618)-N(6))-methyltransferase RlmF [Paraglaciecola marina]|uniref:23S rRNA (adenine(1618)-N(6))-methyltransferase RlmF n=2 Tax=Paraglaciecola TaxID=1621534 RepID=UPI00105E2966|nr:23S rRNA (adenine(1618)-N(6))-methyltransferase RlmF [Paraglaciecola marina]